MPASALIEELSRQCDEGQPPSGTMVPSSFQIVPGLDAAVDRRAAAAPAAAARIG